MNIHQTWKMRLENIFYFHHHFLTGLVILVGGIVACWMLYVFLFTAALVELTPQETNDAGIKHEALSRLKLWNTKRKEEAKKTITIPSSAFAVPPSTP